MKITGAWSRCEAARMLLGALVSFGVAGWLGTVGAVPGQAAPGPEHVELDRRIREAADLPGEPHVFESMGVTRADVPLRSLENREPVRTSRRRVVVVGGLDGNDRSVDAVLGAVRWFKTTAPAALRTQWSLSALPCGNPEGWAQLKPTNDAGGKPAVNYPPLTGFFEDRLNAEARYVWRWVAFQAPDLVVEVGGANRMSWLVPPAFAALGAGVHAQPLVSPDTLAMALGHDAPSGLAPVPTLFVEARAADGPELLRQALTAAASLPHSALRAAIERRLGRPALSVAEVLANRYPQNPFISYIPATAWDGALRLAILRNEPALAERVQQSLAPYLSGEKQVIDGTPDPVKLGGCIMFADLALSENNPAARKLALEAAALYRPTEAGAPARFTTGVCEDLYMTAALLGRAGKLSGDASYYDLMAGTLLSISGRIQRSAPGVGGIFEHGPQSPFAWGRGNGFAALGLMEGLTYLPKGHPQRAAILARYRKEMAAVLPLQTPEGTWREVIDHPESYREVTATAMILAAMARGVRLGWLDASYRPVAQRAWEGLSARIAEDGSLTDVCTGTGTGPSLRYYYDRPATSGFDDRGGAMCLLAALEMGELK